MWDFGDGTSASTTDPSNLDSTSRGMILFNHVTLTSTTQHGCVDSHTDSIDVYAQPNVGFTSSTDQNYPESTVDFTNMTNEGYLGLSLGHGRRHREQQCSRIRLHIFMQAGENTGSG